MNLRLIALTLALCSNFAPALFAGCPQGTRLINEAGGILGVSGIAGPPGAPGIAGAAGSQGIPGVPGIPGAPGLLSFSDFFAVMPTDNPSPVLPGFPVEFPRNGSTNGVIIRNPLSPTNSFILPTVGSYLVEFQVSVDAAPPPSQLMLRLNGVPLADSVVGRDTGTSQIVGISTVTTSAAGSILEVINPPTDITALTVPPFAGSVNTTTPVSAHLVIIRIR